MKHCEMISGLQEMLDVADEGMPLSEIYYNALTQAIDLLRWRDPVKEPPSEKDWVLCAVEGYMRNLHEICIYKQDEAGYYFQNNNNTRVEVEKVYYWIPLPQFPEVE